MNNRLQRLQAQVEQPLLVTNPVNVKYLVGFDSSNCALIVERDRVRLLTDFRYITAAREVADVEAVETRRDTIGELGETLAGQEVTFESLMPWSLHQRLQSAGVKLTPANGTIERMRAVKDEQELAALREACAITDRAFERLTEVQFTGRAERYVAWELVQIFHEEGAHEPSFEFIVGSGPTGSQPHGRAGDRVIGRGELVVIDAGGIVDGYASDYTRTFATGPLDREAVDVYETVLLAQDAALGGIRSGLSGAEADALARAIIDASPFAGAMGHGLGHGLGLDVHELPRVSSESSDVLQPGNVVTVEPGVHLEGKFGVRIEDDVVVTADGIENLTGFRKDLLEVS